MADAVDQASRSAKRGSTSSVAMGLTSRTCCAEIGRLVARKLGLLEPEMPTCRKGGAGHCVGVGRLEALAQIRRQPWRDRAGKAPDQRQALNALPQKHAEQVADRVRGALENAASNRIAPGRMTEHDRREGGEIGCG